MEVLLFYYKTERMNYVDSINTNLSINTINKIEPLKIRLKNIFNDRIGFIVFSSVLLQSIIFIQIIQTDGASKLNTNITDSIFWNIKVSILFELIIISFSLLFSGFLRLAYLIAVNLVFSALLIGDLWYFRGFQDFLSFHSFGEAKNLNDFFKNIMTMSRFIDLFFIVDNIIIISLTVLLRNKYRFMKRNFKLFSVLFFIPVIILVYLHMTLDYNGEDYEGLTLFKTKYVPLTTMQDLTPLGYHFYDAAMYLNDLSLHKLSTEEKNEITKWLNYKNESLPDNEYSAMLKGKNIIFIQVESLENFVINQKYNGETLTPNLNKLLNNSLYFSNIYAQVNNGNSGDADLMANASILPLRRGSTFFRYPDNQYNTLAKLLKEENYKTQSMHASNGTIWNVSAAIKNFGFDESYDYNNIQNADVYGMGITDKSFFSIVLNSLEKEKSPFFYYTVTVSSHVPFDIRDDMKSLNLTESFDKTSMGKYFQAIHYADEQIGNFINGLDKKGLLDNTMVVIYGDHEGVHKYYNDEITSLSEFQPWWNNDSKIPLIIYNKNIKGKEITTAGGEVDILPTTAYLIGLDKNKYENTTMGRNLLNTEKSYAILNDYRIIGKENLSSEDIDHINKSFDIADLILETNYFDRKDN